MKPSISFENTEVAFKSKSNLDLKRAYWLFKIIGFPRLMKVGKALTKIGLTLRLPIRGLIKATIFKQFCGGETIAECAQTTKLLDEFNIGTILDYSVEGKESEIDFEATTAEIIDTIKTAHGNKHIPFCVFKVTGLAQNHLLQKVSEGKTLNKKEEEAIKRVEARIERICNEAFLAETPIFIDAEETWIQPCIDQFAQSMMRKCNTKKAIVYNTIQLYRTDRLEFLKQNYQDAVAHNYFLGEKLVRGAYMEKERERAKEKGYASPIHKTKSDTDKCFNDAVKFCVENIDRISFCAGTHNEESSLRLTELMADKNINNHETSIFFAQLYGMSDHISYNLSSKGYNVAKYVPYGPVREVLPYLIRRAEENTSAAGQTGRELTLIIKEKRRRNSLKS